MTAHGGKTLGHHIMRASVAVGIAHVLFKLAGLVQAKVMGHYLSGQDFDIVYAFAFENCIFSLFLIGEEVVGPAAMPIFMRELDERGETSAWSFANTLLTLQALLLATIMAILVVFPGPVVRLWTAWSPQHQAASYFLGLRSVRALAPALLGLSLGSTTYVLLNAHKRFFLAAFGDAVWKLAVVAALILGVGLLRGGVEVLIWGLVAGSLLKVATHLAGLRDKLHHFRPRLNLHDPALRSMLLLAAPLLLGIVFAKVRDVVNNVYILSELDAAGLMQANSMGRKLQSTLLFIVPYTLSIAVFPFFCEMVDRKDHAKLGEFVTRAGRQLLAIFIPLAVVVAVLATPLTSLVFGGGRFDALAVKRTALTTACYTFALPAAAVEALAMQAFFAHRRMVAVTVAGIVFSAFSMLVSWLGLRLGGGREMVVLGAIAGGFALSRALKSVTLVGLLRRSAPVFPARATGAFLLRVALVSLVAALAARTAADLGQRLCCGAAAAGGMLNDLTALSAGAAAAGLAFLAGCRLLRVNEPFDLLRWLLARRRGH